MAECVILKDEREAGNEGSPGETTVPNGRRAWNPRWHCVVKVEEGSPGASHPLRSRNECDAEIPRRITFKGPFAILIGGVVDQIRRGGMVVELFPRPSTRRTFGGLAKFRSPTTNSCAFQA
jgi:hypothetical protein